MGGGGAGWGSAAAGAAGTALAGAALAGYVAVGSAVGPGGPGWPPPGEPEMGSRQLGPRGFTRRFTSRQGLRLHCSFWPAAGESKGVIVLVHGHGSHCAFEFLLSPGHGAESGPRTYLNSWVERLNAEGWSCAGIDHQSMGRSEGIGGCPNFIEDFDDLVGDLEEFCDGQMAGLGGPAFSSGLPRVILGSSLGGAVATSALLRRPDLAHGLMLLSPMLSLEKVARKGSNYYLRPLMTVVSAWWPTLQVVKVEKCPILHFQEEFQADPLNYHGGTRVRNAQCYLKACESIMSRCEELTVPFITSHSADDPYTDPDGSVSLVERAKSTDKTLNLVRGMWHIINQEPGNEKILEKLVEWLDARWGQGTSLQGGQ